MRQHLIDKHSFKDEEFRKKSLVFLTPFVLGLTLYTGGAALISAINLIQIMF